MFSLFWFSDLGFSLPNPQHPPLSLSLCVVGHPGRSFTSSSLGFVPLTTRAAGMMPSWPSAKATVVTMILSAKGSRNPPSTDCCGDCESGWRSSKPAKTGKGERKYRQVSVCLHTPKRRRAPNRRRRENRWGEKKHTHTHISMHTWKHNDRLR